MLLKQKCVIAILEKYEFKISKKPNADPTIMYFEYHKPNNKIYSLKIEGDGFVYNDLACFLLKKFCEAGGIEFQTLEAELRQCI